MVTLPDYFEGEGQLINALFAAGLELLHLRKPENSEQKFRKLMMEIKPEHYPAISIHQHHELAEEFSIRRLHFTGPHRMLMEDTDLDELHLQGFCLSSSIHDLDELQNLYGFDYVFFGPVFNSISKIGYHSMVNDDFVLPPHAVNIFAIGGVEKDRLKKLKEMHFDGAAVLGTLWHMHLSPLLEFEKIRKAMLDLH